MSPTKEELTEAFELALERHEAKKLARDLESDDRVSEMFAMMIDAKDRRREEEWQAFVHFFAWPFLAIASLFRRLADFMPGRRMSR